jgi:hypothetical protein
MHAQHLPINQSADCEEVKDLSAVPPCIGVAILALALIIEAIHLAGRVRERHKVAFKHSSGGRLSMDGHTNSRDGDRQNCVPAT